MEKKNMYAIKTDFDRLDNPSPAKMKERIEQIGILIHNYEMALNEALEYAKELALHGISRPWIDRTDFQSTTKMKREPRIDRSLVGGARMRLEVE